MCFLNILYALSKYLLSEWIMVGPEETHFHEGFSCKVSDFVKVDCLFQGLSPTLLRREPGQYIKQFGAALPACSSLCVCVVVS